VDFHVEIACYRTVNASNGRMLQDLGSIEPPPKPHKAKELCLCSQDPVNSPVKTTATIRSNDLHRSTATTLGNPKLLNTIETYD